MTKKGEVYVADFNVAREKSGEYFRMLTKTGTLAFSAPEIFTFNYYKYLTDCSYDVIYSEKIDIWSAGTVLYAMLSGHLPFEDENVAKLIS